MRLSGASRLDVGHDARPTAPRSCVRRQLRNRVTIALAVFRNRGPGSVDIAASAGLLGHMESGR